MATGILAEVLGGGAAICSMVSFAPQLVKIWREHDAASVSMRMYAISVLGFSLWTSYGLLIGRWPVIVCNAVCLAICVMILILKRRYACRS
ncbi:MAG: SemiSWEET transporter [Proteobacteria bacterium]|nr:SemiSWEET transporter [Pseudomonadota bacterium]